MPDPDERVPTANRGVFLPKKMATKTFVIHSRENAVSSMRTRRIDAIAELVSRAGFSAKPDVVCEFEASALNTRDAVNKYVSYADSDPGMPDRAVVDAYAPLRTNMHLYQLSCAMNHVEALRRVAEMREDGVGVILEDDVEFDPSTCHERLADVVREVRGKEELCFLGLPAAGDEAGRRDFWEVFRMFPPSVESYVVTPKAARAILKHALPIRYAFHVHLGYTLQKCRDGPLAVTIACPGLFVDGSKAGSCLSSVLPNNPLVYSGDYAAVLQALQAASANGTVDVVSADRCEALIGASKVGGHPQMVHLLGRVYAELRGDNEKARELFQAAYAELSQMKTFINHETQVLRDLIRSHGPPVA